MNNYKEAILQLFKQTDFPHNPKNCIHDLLGNKTIVLYGAGSGFFTFSAIILKRYGFKVHAILDRKLKGNNSFHGIPAFSPREYKPTESEKENAVVIITVGKKKYHVKILNCLRGLGFKNVLFSTDIYEYHLCYPSIELEKEGFSYFLKNKNRIMRCLSLFIDNLSREVFTRFVQTHMLRKPIRVPNRPLKEQYFPKDISLKKGCSRFINCGAYDGDTIRL